MSRADESRRPSVGAVALEQLRLTAGDRPRRSGLVLLALFALMALLAGLDGFPGVIDPEPSTDAESGWRLIGSEEMGVPAGTGALLLAFAWLVFAALWWPLRVWRDAGPSRRGYHYAMPVDRRLHDLLRVGAGAVWLGAVVISLLAIGVVIGVVAGRVAGLAQVSLAGWLTYLLSPLALYLLGSIGAVASDRPGLWTFGLLFGLTAVQMASGLIPLPVLDQIAAVLVGGRYGFTAAASGGFVPDLLGGPAGSGGVLATILWLVGCGALVVVAAGARWRAR